MPEELRLAHLTTHELINELLVRSDLSFLEQVMLSHLVEQEKELDGLIDEVGA